MHTLIPNEPSHVQLFSLYVRHAIIYVRLNLGHSNGN